MCCVEGCSWFSPTGKVKMLAGPKSEKIRGGDSLCAWKGAADLDFLLNPDDLTFAESTLAHYSVSCNGHNMPEDL